ncbi:MAG TPA: hypothetical protein VM491_18490 [Burkholderiaceae bacterium]|nr:hypothetical protein [Burkholderiaceae bacterium]
MRSPPGASKSTHLSIKVRGKKVVGNYRVAGAMLWVFHRLSFRTVPIDPTQPVEAVATRLLHEMAAEAAADGGKSNYDYSLSSRDGLGSE